MAEMGLAAAADYFRADHAVRAIVVFLDGLVRQGAGKAGPTAAGVKFCFGSEQWLATAHTLVGSGRLGGFILAREGRLGTLLSRHIVLIWRKLLLPFTFRLLDLLAHKLPFGSLWHTFHQYPIRRTALTFPHTA